MADEIDLANDLIDNEVSRALRKIREGSNLDSIGFKTCAECGEDIPKARQTMGFKLCVGCASEIERRKSLFAD